MDFVDGLLPVAHADGIKVLGWDFPKLDDIGVDYERALAAINYVAADGSRLDGFVPDIETGSEGTNLTVDAVDDVRKLAPGGGRHRTTCWSRACRTRRRTTIGFYPYAELAPYFDALAPMVYWLNREPDTDVAAALDWLAQFGKPMLPIGQAYDGTAEGGRPGPTGEEITRFITTPPPRRRPGCRLLVLAARSDGGVEHHPARRPVGHRPATTPTHPTATPATDRRRPIRSNRAHPGRVAGLTDGRIPAHGDAFRGAAEGTGTQPTTRPLKLPTATRPHSSFTAEGIGLEATATG